MGSAFCPDYKILWAHFQKQCNTENIKEGASTTMHGSELSPWVLGHYSFAGAHSLFHLICKIGTRIYKLFGHLPFPQNALGGNFSRFSTGTVLGFLHLGSTGRTVCHYNQPSLRSCVFHFFCISKH